jgi:hypothetical protein
MELLHQLGLGADRVKRLQQERSLVELSELAIQREQHLVDDETDQAQGCDPVLEINIREQFTTPLI